MLQHLLGPCYPFFCVTSLSPDSKKLCILPVALLCTNAWRKRAGVTVRTLAAVDGRGQILEKVELNDQLF